jgi:hypothetical protein
MSDNSSRVLVILDPENVAMAGWQEAMSSLEALGMEPTFKIAAAANGDHISGQYQQALANAGFEVEFFETSAAKDGADICLISRALQIYYRSGYDVVYFISYDSDFQYLARILKQEGVHTIGVEGDRLSSVMRPYLDAIVEPTPYRIDIPHLLACDLRALFRTSALIDKHGWIHFDSALSVINRLINKAMGDGVSVYDVLEAMGDIEIRTSGKNKHRWLRLRRKSDSKPPAFNEWRLQRQSAVLAALIRSYDDLAHNSDRPAVSYRDLLRYAQEKFGIPAHWPAKILQYNNKGMNRRLGKLMPQLVFQGTSEGNMIVERRPIPELQLTATCDRKLMS